ncbi:MAG: hypothetical protein CMH54_08800 [Myxococcales bacterium]|nr:hypothetical protein [Myxococcales bacterium]
MISSGNCRRLPVLIIAGVFLLLAGTWSQIAFSQTGIGGKRTVAIIGVSIDGDRIPVNSSYLERIDSVLSQNGSIQTLSSIDVTTKLRRSNLNISRFDTNERIQSLQSAVKKAEVQISRSQAQTAVSTLKTARRKLEESLDELAHSTTMWQLLRRTYLKLARAHVVDLKQKRAAESVLSEAIRLLGVDETVANDPDFHPRVVQLYGKTVRKQRIQQNAQLKITSNPEGASIFINGKSIGQTTPHSISNIAPGRYYVQVRSNGMTSGTHAVDIKQKQTGTVWFDLPFEKHLTTEAGAAVIQFSRRSDINSKSKTIVPQLAALLNVDQIVLVGLARKGSGVRLYGQIFDGRTGKRVRQVSARANENILDPIAVNTVVATLMGQIAPAGPKWHDSKLGWGLTSVGVVSLVVMAYYLGVRSDALPLATDCNYPNDCGAGPPSVDPSTGQRTCEPNATCKSGAATAPATRRYKENETARIQKANEAADAGNVASVTGTIGVIALAAGITAFVLHGSSTSSASGSTALTLPGGVTVQPQLGPGFTHLNLGFQF